MGKPTAGLDEKLEMQLGAGPASGACSRIVGMKNVPATGMAPAMYAATILTPARIEAMVQEVLAIPREQGSAPMLENELAWIEHAPSWKMR